MMIIYQELIPTSDKKKKGSKYSDSYIRGKVVVEKKGYFEFIKDMYKEENRNLRIFQDMCRSIKSKPEVLEKNDNYSMKREMNNEIYTYLSKFETKLDIINERLSKIEQTLSISEENEDVIIIKNYSYRKARKLIEKYLQENERAIYPSELMIEYGIELKLCHRIFSDLLKEEKIV